MLFPLKLLHKFPQTLRYPSTLNLKTKRITKRRRRDNYATSFKSSVKVTKNVFN